MKLNRNDKFILYAVIFIIFIVILLFTSLYFIWSNKNRSDIDTYKYNGFESECVSMYKKQLQILLKSNNSKMLIQRLDEQFLTDNNLTRNNLSQVKEYLEKNKLFAYNNNAILDYTISANEKTGLVVYRFKYYNVNGNTKYVNLIETEPYLYTISFENGYTTTSARKSVVDSTDDLKIELSLIESKENSIKYNAKITNISNKTIQFNFNNVASVELILNDGSKVKLSSVIASSDDYILNANSYLNQELFFAIPIEKHGEIKSIVFYNVLIEKDKLNLEIEF